MTVPNGKDTADLGSIPGLGRVGNGISLQYTCLKILWREEFGRLESKGLQRVGHNWVTEQQDVFNMQWM